MNRFIHCTGRSRPRTSAAQRGLNQLAIALTVATVLDSRMAQYPDTLDGVFQALADPTRRAVLRRLGRGPASVSDLAEPFDMALPSFLKHIRLLEGSGLIRTRKTGRVRMCTIDRDRLDVIEDWLSEQRGLWVGRTDRLEHFVTLATDDARTTDTAQTTDKT